MGTSYVVTFILVFLLTICTEWSPVLADSRMCPSAVICSCSDEELSANCSSRGFSTVPPGLPAELNVLDMSRNRLRRINSTELFRLSSLEYLDLSRNRLTELTMSRSGQSVHLNLRKLDLSHNRISSVKSLWLTGLERLQDLNLANNQIESLPSRTLFEIGSSLRHLNLKSNRIVSLEPECFNDLYVLKELTLTKNKLSSFPKEVDLQNLEVLELNKNSFVQIEGLMFNGLPKLRKLRLKRNQIEFLSDGAFYISNGQIEEISLDRNRITNVRKGWLYGLDQLRYLSLSSNRIDFIASDGWDPLKKLEELDLRSNKLQLLDRESLCSLPELRFLYLQDNKISHIDGEEGDDRYCSSRTFGDVPLLEELYLDGNEISHTIEDMNAPFKGLKYLRTLSLSRNKIKLIGEHAFSGGLHGLEEIDVRENFGLSTVQENAFENLPKLRTINLDSESMLCDCYLKWFPRWLNGTGIQGSGFAKCAHPENLKGRAVQEVAYEAFTCDDFPKPYIIQQPETQISLRGDNLTLFCRAASTSPANMTFLWKLDSEIMEDVKEMDVCHSGTRCVQNIAHTFDGKGREITSQLHLTNLTYDDAGKYQCLVSNAFGVTYSEKADITVYVYPKFVVTPDDSEITVVAGQSATFECGANGFPAPKVKWQKEMKPGTNCSGGMDGRVKECFPAAFERRLFFKSGSLPHDKRTTINTIEMINITIADMGRYTCNASNPAGSITYNVTLSVMESPKILETMEDAVFRENESAVIKCMVSGMPKPVITWFKDGKQLLTTERHFFAAEDQVLLITGAAEEDAGRYDCIADNQLGKVNMSSIVKITSGSVLFTTPKQSNETTSVANPIMNNTIIIVIATSCAVIGILFVWAITCCCKSQSCCFKPRQPTATLHYNNSQQRNLNMNQPRGRARSKDDGCTTLINRSATGATDTSYLTDDIHDSSKNKLLSSTPHSMNISSHPGKGEFEKRKEMDITSKMLREEMKRSQEAAKSSVLYQLASDTDPCADSSLLSMSSINDDNEKKALLRLQSSSHNPSIVGKPKERVGDICLDIHSSQGIYHDSSSSEKDSGTGDSKRSNENVDNDLTLSQENMIHDNYEEEDMAEGEYGEIGNGEVGDYHLSGGGESAMNLEEFEATMGTIKASSDDHDEHTPPDSLNIYAPFSDEVDSAIGERLSGEPPTSSNEHLLADSGCGEAMPIYSAPDSIASSSIENNTESSIFGHIQPSKTLNSFLDNSLSSISSSSYCHSKHQNVGKKRHQSSNDLKNNRNIRSAEKESALEEHNKVCEQPSEFRTFYPKGKSNRGGGRFGSSYSAFHTGSMQNGLDCDPKPSKKRASTFELNGSCYLSLEPSVGGELNSSTVDPVLYRGGVGTLPKDTAGFELHQRLLEESLNNSDYALDRRRKLQEQQQNFERKERSSSRTRRSMIFGRNRKNSTSKNNDISTISGSSSLHPKNNSSYTNSLPHSSKHGSSKSRSKSNKHKPPNGYSGNSQEYKSLLSRVAAIDHTEVPSKSNELFA